MMVFLTNIIENETCIRIIKNKFSFTESRSNLVAMPEITIDGRFLDNLLAAINKQKWIDK